MSNNTEVDVDALLEESFNSLSKVREKDEINEKKRSLTESSSSSTTTEQNGNGNGDLESSKRRKSGDRDSRDREYSRDRGGDRDRDRDRDREYSRDRGGDRDRDYRDRDRDRDYYSRDRYDSRDRYSRDDRYRDDRYRSSGGRYDDRYSRDDRDRYSRDDRYRDDRYRSSGCRYDDRYSRDDKYRDDRYSKDDSRYRDRDRSPTGNRATPEKKDGASSSSTTTTPNSSSTSTPTSSGPFTKDAANTPPKSGGESDEESDQRTVFVTNLSPRVKEQELFDYFSKACSVAKVKLIIDRATQKFKGVGYVEFTDKSMVPAALALSGSKFMEQQIRVFPIQPEKKAMKSSSTGNCRIYAGNLNLTTTEKQLESLFSQYGSLDFIKIHIKPASKYAFIQFRDPESAKRAILELNGNEFLGKNIKLNMVSEEKSANGTYIPIHNPNLSTINPNSIQAHLVNPQLNPTLAAVIANHSFKENTPLSSLDDDDGGIPLTAQDRALLTAKLQGKTSTAVPTYVAAAPRNPYQQLQQQQFQIHQQQLQLQHQQQQLQQLQQSTPPTPTPPTTQPAITSTCLLLKNMFDPTTETEPDWDKEILQETQQECSQFGPIKHIYLDKNSQGHIYIRYDNTESPLAAIAKLNCRWFSQKLVSAELVPEAIYKLKFPF
eukprot:gene9719-11935_t